MEIFRNASYAYQVLGRDETIRRKYDSKYTSNDYLDALENVGTATSDLLVPLTMEIAVPLLNMTAQAIGSFAIPFLKNAFAQVFDTIHANKYNKIVYGFIFMY